MRTHIIISDDLIKRLDNLIGRGKRSRFIEEAIKEKIRKEELIKALKETAGVLSVKEHKEWQTREKTAMWVRNSRRQDEKRRGSLKPGQVPSGYDSSY